MVPEINMLILMAVSVGFAHVLLGPDHYLPFVALARARNWSLRKTMTLTFLSGLGHTLGSVLIGLMGIHWGTSLTRLKEFEIYRGDLAAWMLWGLGLVLIVLGLRKIFGTKFTGIFFSNINAVASIRPFFSSGKWRIACPGLVARCRQARDFHRMNVSCRKVNNSVSERTAVGAAVQWFMVSVLVLGPCEPLIPLLMYPAAKMGFWGIIGVSCVFSAVTIITMMAAVGILYKGVGIVPWRIRCPEIWAGTAILGCAAGMIFWGW